MNKKENILIATEEIYFLKKVIYDRIDLKINNLTSNKEGIKYLAYSYYLNNINIEHRLAKVTPKKVGQFVAIWKRNDKGLTIPYDVSDNINFFMVVSKKFSNIGVFIFPKEILAKKELFLLLIMMAKEG